MDATAQPPGPDDDRAFRAIVSGLGLESEFAAAEPAPTEPTATPPSKPTPPPSPPPAPAPAVAAEPTPVKPERPPLVAPAPPRDPDLGHVETTGNIASLAGYIMSVAIGSFGQILFLGTWLAVVLPSPGNWAAGVMGAAFAEITMVGGGNTSVTKRHKGGRWKLLFVMACVACGAAVVMQLAHWWPKSPGVALLFGLASCIGFLVHMTIKHSTLRDYEEAQARYERELAEYRAQQEQRYAEELAEYHTQVAEQQRERRQATAPPPASTAPPRRKSSGKGSRAGKPDAVRIGLALGITTPAPLRDALVDAGYTLPSSKSSLENWCKAIKEAMPNND